MIKRAIIIITFIFILFLLGGISAVAITNDEAKSLYKETKMLCLLYGKQCTVVQVKDGGMFAETNANNTIRISTGLLYRMNIPQVRSVLFHEVGHVVFNHVTRTLDYFDKCGRDCNLTIISEMRKDYELQADRFSTYVCKYAKLPQDLPGALLILTPKEDINKEQPTHPSTARRIEQVWRVLNE